MKNSSVKGYKLPRYHFTLTSSHYVQQVCANLFLRFGLNGFRHNRQYDEGSRFELTTDPHWSEHYMAQGYFNYFYVDNQFKVNRNQFPPYLLWDACNKMPPDSELAIKDAIVNFNLGSTLTISRYSQTWTDRFDFTAPRNTKRINEIFLNNLCEFDQFINYYLDTMSDLIRRAHNARDYLPYSIELCSDNPKNFIPQRILHALNFNSSKQLISNPSKPILTKRELECLYWLNYGKTVPEIALILQISYRTVEKFISNIKCKFNCRTFFQLGQITHRLRLDYLLQGFEF